MIVQIVMAFAMSATAHAGQWTCGANQWLQGPEVRNGQFVGIVGSTCHVQASGGGIQGLRDFIIAKTQRTRVNAGPYSEQFYGLPSVRYDATDTIGSGDNALTVRALIHVASNDSTRLIFATASTSVQGGGMASYVHSLNSVLDVTAADDGSYTLQFTLDTTIDKPWYAPDGMFQSKAADTVMSSFQDAKGSLIPDVANNL